ncbi:MAG TPA: hypothetical protein VJ785_01850 [Anaerolineales bacterium]|nr:hypothetical protein [Anaerolineales bacterium]
MANTPARDIVIRLDSIDQLFNEPDVNPFSDEEVDVLGEPALLRAVRRLLARRVRNWEGMRLVLELPADQITPGLEKETEAALRRYSAAKIEDNRLTIRLSRTRSLIGLGIVLVISILVILIVYFLLTSIFTRASDAAKALVASSLSVFVWVSLWGPMEKLLFDWVQPHMENTVLRKIPALDIVIRPKS